MVRALRDKVYITLVGQPARRERAVSADDNASIDTLIFERINGFFLPSTVYISLRRKSPAWCHPAV
jgi:hypothetical protein